MKKAALYLASVVLLFFAASALTLAAEQTKDLESTPQGKIYRVQEKAIKAGDFEAYKKTMTKASAAGIDKQMKDAGMHTKKGMELLKVLLPTELKFVSLKVDKNKATLMATGKMDGEVNKGTIELEQEDGQWKIAQQSWTNKK